MSSHNTSFPSRTDDRWFTLITRSSAVVAAAVLVMVISFLFSEAWPALASIPLGRFFSDSSWHPLSGQFNLLPMIVATILTTIGALALAGPLGIASATFSQFYAPPIVSAWYQRLVALLAGIPSVVFGLWGLVVLVPLIATIGGSGQSLLTATLVLGLMILPTVALTAQAALAAVPAELIAGGAALGLQRHTIAWRIAIPAASGGIGVGLLLALSRAMGETMAVMMLSGNVVEMPDSLLSPVRTLTANIALEMGYAGGMHRSILFASGLILMAVVTVVVLLAEFAGGQRNGR